MLSNQYNLVSSAQVVVDISDLMSDDLPPPLIESWHLFRGKMPKT